MLVSIKLYLFAKVMYIYYNTKWITIMTLEYNIWNTFLSSKKLSILNNNVNFIILSLKISKSFNSSFVNLLDIDCNLKCIYVQNTNTYVKSQYGDTKHVPMIVQYYILFCVYNPRTT